MQDDDVRRYRGMLIRMFVTGPNVVSAHLLAVRGSHSAGDNFP